MATPTYDLLATVDVTSNVSNITVSNIPQTYKDLHIHISARSSNGDFLRMRLNNDTSSQYRATQAGVDGDRADYTDGSDSGFFTFEGGIDTSRAGIFDLVFFNYSATNHYKSGLSLVSVPTDETTWGAIFYQSTSAISSLYLFLRFGALITAGSTVSVYGVVG